MADNKGENQIVNKLADSCGNVGSAGVDCEALVFPDGSADVPVYEVIYNSGDEEGDGASEEHIQVPPKVWFRAVFMTVSDPST